jgi:hypothetical protein
MPLIIVFLHPNYEETIDSETIPQETDPGHLSYRSGHKRKPHYVSGALFILQEVIASHARGGGARLSRNTMERTLYGIELYLADYA